MTTTLESLITTVNLNDASERQMLADELEIEGRHAEAVLLRGDGGVGVHRSGRLIRVFRGRCLTLPQWFHEIDIDDLPGGYLDVGYACWHELKNADAYKVDPQQWQAELDWLEEMIHIDRLPDEDEAIMLPVIGWLEYHIPAIMEEVGRDQLIEFYTGFAQAAREDV